MSTVMGKVGYVRVRPGQPLPTPGEYVWPYLGRLELRAPIPLACPLCHEMLYAFMAQPSGRVTMINDQGAAIVDLLPETHTAVGCAMCRMVFTVLTEAFEAAR